MMENIRTYIYIDGFNFYYGAVKGTPYKWLDFKSLFIKILNPDNQIISIKYFTAPVSGRASDKNQPGRQKIYLTALKKYIPEMKIYHGFFLVNPVFMPLKNPTPTQKYAEVIKTEEKGSDVNLAVHLLNDAWLDKYDCAVVVSNDSDLSEAMRLVRQNHPEKIIGLVNPHKEKPSAQLKIHANFYRQVRKGALASSQLPDPIPGTNIYKPKEW